MGHLPYLRMLATFPPFCALDCTAPGHKTARPLDHWPVLYPGAQSVAVQDGGRASARAG